MVQTGRLQEISETVQEWDLFVAFLLLDGHTAGKSAAPLEWFLATTATNRTSRFSLDDLM